MWHTEGVPLPCSPPQCLPACHCSGWDGAVSFAVPAMALCPGSVSAPCRPAGCCAERSAAELCFPALCSPALWRDFRRSQISPVPRSLHCPLARASVCTAVCRTIHPRAKTSPHTHLCIHTHVQAHPCTAGCAHSIRVHASVCKTQQPCAKTFMHAFVFMHTHTCVHTILLHTHVHKDTSAALALHTAICTHTRAKLSPTDTVHTPTCSAHSCSAPSLHTPVCTHTCTHSSRTKCRSRGTANTQAVGNVRRKGAPLRSFILLSLMKALGHSWSPILRCGLLRGSSSVGYGGPGMVMGVLSGTVGVGEHRRGLRHKGRSEPPSNRRDP